MAQQNFESWYSKALDAINHLDAAPAYYLLRTLNKNRANWGREYQTSEKFKSDIQMFDRMLRFVAFSELPLNEAQQILSAEVLTFLRSGISLDDRLSVRAVVVSYGDRSNEQQSLRHAILSNQEKIGGNTIGGWLSLFDRKYNPLTRNNNSIIDFLTREPKIVSLSTIEKSLLRAVLIAYEDWLATGRLNIYDVAFLYKEDGTEYQVGTKIDYSLIKIDPSTDFLDNEQQPVSKSVQQIVSFPLLPALSKFENLGNQLITNERIRVKSQQEPVRPSLLYWLKYYRDELGIGQHNSVERGDFLFRSENGRKLSPDERERISLILKSLEENLPLSIDTERQEIIFPVFQGVQVSSHQSEPLRTAIPPVRRVNNDFRDEKSTIPPVEIPKRPAFQNSTFFSPVQGDSNDLPKKERIDQIKSSEFVGRNAPVLNSYANNALGGSGMSFSTGHIFPAEKEAIVQKAILAVPSSVSTPSSRPAPTKKAFDDSNPFIINPSRGGEE